MSQILVTDWHYSFNALKPDLCFVYERESAGVLEKFIKDKKQVLKQANFR